VIKLIKGHIEVVSKRLNFILKLFKTIFKEYIASEIITIHRWRKIWVRRSSGDLLFLHLSRGSISHLILVEIGIQKGVISLSHHSVQSYTWIHIFEVLNVVDLFSD